MPRRPADDEAGELSLLPILNLVLILIPLLLLSVVFLEIAVISVSMAQKTMGPPPETETEPPKRLQVWITKKGFIIMQGGGDMGPGERPLPAIDECRDRGQNLTVCLKKGAESIDNPLDRYNWMELYNQLLKIKRDPKWKEHKTLEIVAGVDITFDILIKAMDAARYQRVKKGTEDAKQGEEFSDEESFNNSTMPRPEQEDEQGRTVRRPVDLFPQVVLGQPKRG